MSFITATDYTDADREQDREHSVRAYYRDRDEQNPPYRVAVSTADRSPEYVEMIRQMYADCAEHSAKIAARRARGEALLAAAEALVGVVG